MCLLHIKKHMTLLKIELVKFSNTRICEKQEENHENIPLICSLFVRTRFEASKSEIHTLQTKFLHR